MTARGDRRCIEGLVFKEDTLRVPCLGGRATEMWGSVEDESVLRERFDVHGARAVLPGEARELQLVPPLVRRAQELDLDLVDRHPAPSPRGQELPDLLL